jgi:uncharacterized protein (TIGR02118 family)
MHRMTVEYHDPADADAFESAYRERHVPLVQALPGIERFTLTRPRGSGAPYLVAELWFADGEAMKASLSSPEMGAVAADAETYEVGRRTMWTGAVEEITAG